MDILTQGLLGAAVQVVKGLEGDLVSTIEKFPRVQGKAEGVSRQAVKVPDVKEPVVYPEFKVCPLGWPPFVYDLICHAVHVTGGKRS